MKPFVTTGLKGLALAVGLAGCGGGPRDTVGTYAQVWSRDAALTFTLRDVCLAAKSSGRPEADFALRPSAMPVRGARAPAVPGRAWYTGSGVYVVDQDQPDICYVRVEGGEGPVVRASAISLLQAYDPSFAPGRSGLAVGGSVLRTLYCSTGSQPLIALISSQRADAPGGPAMQISVFRSDPASARDCAPNGPGDGSDRPF